MSEGLAGEEQVLTDRQFWSEWILGRRRGRWVYTSLLSPIQEWGRLVTHMGGLLRTLLGGKP